MKINRFWLAGGLVAVALGLGITASIQATALEYVSVKQLIDNPARYRGKPIKVTGTIVAETTKVSTNDAGQSVLEFQVKGQDGAVASVYHRGPKPDAFKDGGTVILEGRYDRGKNQIRAETLLAKCPSRYEADFDSGKSAHTAPTQP